MENSQAKHYASDKSDPANWDDCPEDQGPENLRCQECGDFKDCTLKKWTVFCAICEDAAVEKKGDACEWCHEAAHEDNKCRIDCPICESERIKAEG